MILAPPGRLVLGVSALHSERKDSEHLLADVLTHLGVKDVVGCTHLVSTPWRHEAISVEAPEHTDSAVVSILPALGTEIAAVLLDSTGVRMTRGPHDRRAGALEAAEAAASRTSGRAVAFPGRDLLVGDVPVQEILTRTAVDAVISSHGAYDVNAVLRTGDFIRPSYNDGQMIVHVGHSDPALLMPWETADPGPCCGGH